MEDAEEKSDGQTLEYVNLILAIVLAAMATPYTVDASFFPSSGAVNPALTVMANGLRVGDHLVERLK